MTFWRRAIRTVLSRLARYTPNVFYYAADMPVSINGVLRDVALSDEGERTELATAAIAISCAAAEMLPDVGDRAVMTMTAVSNRGNPVGHWRVTVERIEEPQEVDA